MKVLICDDLPEENKEFEEAINEANQTDITIERLDKNSLTGELTKLFDNIDNVMADAAASNNLKATEFDDDVDVVILDNNLAELEIKSARLTAESVAGYLRAFSVASYIISVNKNPDVDFDLRYLVGDYATRTDLALNTNHLSNPALWTHETSDAKHGFLPWYWPKLLDVGIRRQKQIKFVEERLADNVLNTFGINLENLEFLSRHARGLLSQAEEQNHEKSSGNESSGIAATFQQLFLASSRSIPDKNERTILSERMHDGSAYAKSVVARVVAADLDLWFRRDLLGPQEVLVDVPHLLMRMPFLLGDAVSDITHWNAAINASNDPPFRLSQKLFEKHLNSARFEFDCWAPSPCFWWPNLKMDETLNKYFFDDHADWADAVFCEDRSKFLPMNLPDGTSALSEFSAEFEGSWNRRPVAHIDEIRYVPKTRFAI